jgi:hypothetical protein
MTQNNAPKAIPDLTVYVDTNCFLQLRDLSDVDWATIAPQADHVEIAVCSAVIRELDRFKVDRDRRKRDRAKRALRLVEAATDGEGFVTELRAARPRVTLRVGVRGRLPWDDHPDLESTSPDDQIVLSALCEAIDGEKLLLSFDNNPIIRARMIGLACRKSPVDWQLPDQPDEGDQAIAKLERELSEARARWPKLELAIVIDAPPAPVIDWEIMQLPPLAEALSERLTRAWLSENPRKPFFNPPDTGYTPMSVFGSRYSDFDVDEYTRAYKKFEASTRRFFDTLDRHVAARCRLRQVGYEIRNVSPVTAERLLVSIEVPGGVVLYDGDPLDLKMGRFEPPKPPKPPKPHDPLDFARHTLHDDLARRLAPTKPRDPTAFFWQDRPDGRGINASLICEEFRAQQIWDGAYWLGVTKETVVAPLTIDLSATNLPMPVSAQAVLKIRDVEADWTNPRVLEMLPRSVVAELAQL